MARQVRRSGWQVVGRVLVVVLVIAGLAAFAALILFAIALQNYGSNK